MKIEISGNPQFTINFTRSLVEKILKLAALHYDGTCRRQLIEGPLVRAMNRMNGLEFDSCVTTMTFREVDLLLKICGVRHMSAPSSDADFSDVDDFVTSSTKALKTANAISSNWHSVIHG
jgi:hypothetical protein